MTRNKQRNELMREESRTRILETAGVLFAQQGFFSVRIADIAKAAAMSQGNIYWYFDSKEAILKAILKDVFDGMEQILVEAERWPGNGRDKVIHLIEGQLAFMEKQGALFQIYMSILSHGGSELFATLGFDTVKIGMGYHRHMTAILNSAIQDGFIPPQNADALAVFFFSFFNGMLVTYGKDWQRIPSPTIIQAALRLLGIPEPGDGRVN